DLALEKSPCQSGIVFHSDSRSGDLTYAAVRGPQAEELSRSQRVIPAGTGIAGFCSLEGVSLALSNLERAPRLLDAEAHSVVCCPMMTHGRTFGCLELVNRTDGPRWGDHELGLLSYIAHQAALYLNAMAH